MCVIEKKPTVNRQDVLDIAFLMHPYDQRFSIKKLWKGKRGVLGAIVRRLVGFSFNAFAFVWTLLTVWHLQINGGDEMVY